ncbi:MAG: hypothetical protein ACRDHP_14960, partial [Ktedonobacterales bacterium]
LVSLLAARQAADGAPGEPDDCDVLRVIAEGARGGKPARLVEEMVVLPHRPWGIGAGDVDTGVPLAIAGILLASGRAETAGVHGAELVFEPHEFLRELAPYGMRAIETATLTDE